ncbi:MAG: serine protein kinase RIO [archaeon]|nr:serine protein kinase RIO [archaeon]
MESPEDFKKLFSEEKVKKIFDKVFDNQSILTLHSLAKKGFFETVEFVVSTGKEAHVFRAVDVSENFRAVKIYKIETSTFRNLAKYLEGDRRFKDVKHSKKDIVFAWAKKEFRNLSLCREAKASAPMPTAVKNNVLVMEFIGENGIACRTLKEHGEHDTKTLEDYYRQTVEFIARILYLKELVHADLSEYNILVKGKKLVFIDIGQGVLTTHPSAEEFFKRDVKNITEYFTRQGLEKSFEDAIKDIKEAGKMLKKRQNN